MTLLPAEAKSMRFTSRYPTDKILGIFEGSFTADASSFLGLPHRTNEAFDHLLGEQVFLQMTYSRDSGTTWQDQHVGVPDLTTPSTPRFQTVDVGCYCTSTQIVIAVANFLTSSATITYKVVAFSI